MREALNYCNVIGTLSETDLEDFSLERDGKTVEGVKGTISVLVHLPSGNVTIPIRVYQNKYKKDGGENSAYKTIMEVKNMKSIASTGSESDADRVACTGSAKFNGTHLQCRAFKGRTGQVVCFPNVTASFVRKATATQNDEASWNLEFVMKSMHYITDKDGVEIEPKKLDVEVVVPIYGDKVEVYHLFATNPSVIAAVESSWESGQTYTAKGRLNFTTSTRTVEVASDFGEPEIKTYVNNISELMITGGTTSPAEEGFDMKDITIALKNRAAAIEAGESGATQKAPGKNSSNPFSDYGF